MPLGDASLCSEKMATPGKKSFCVLEYHTSKSAVTVERAFCAKYAKDPSTDKTMTKSTDHCSSYVDACVART